ncbi:thiamine phosphate synthase, partial [Myxococcota bacterium]|nr:thiamine phosphate synthase [Myxococcota bacterium]
HPPLSKPTTRPALGVTPVQAASSAGVSVFAQGGIGPEQVPALATAGVAGIAVTGSLLQSDDPYAQALAMERALRAATEDS